MWFRLLFYFQPASRAKDSPGLKIQPVTQLSLEISKYFYKKVQGRQDELFPYVGCLNSLSHPVQFHLIACAHTQALFHHRPSFLIIKQPDTKGKQRRKVNQTNK